MQLSNLTYEGKKVYKDEYGNVWAPGDTKLVTDEQSARLLRFPVFLRPKADAKATAKNKTPDKDKTKDDTETDEQKAERLALEEATRLENERQRLKKQEDDTKENMLLTIESMDKGALVEYALKYETKLDKRQAIGALRLEVANLVEQFGAR